MVLSESDEDIKNSVFDHCAHELCIEHAPG